MSIACRTWADPAYSCTTTQKSLFFSPYFFFKFFITSHPSESVVVHSSFSFCICPLMPNHMLVNFTSLLTNFWCRVDSLIIILLKVLTKLLA
ncbi:metallothionein-like protein 3B [Iris pallida]|uniref:Metallothionein-like protein 3B n=1 Tax=Iris pallida TaxID=29817 RepID=A0AAX6H0P7_IRIPA|nr:metallothionein-like protein 3B [Iris pallida]